jgi:signal transduction histidine kinase
MNELINDVLTVNKSESNKIKFTPVETNLYELLTSLLDNIKLSSPENIKFVFDYNAGEKIFIIDNKLITQIVTNLLSNAVKYSPNGGKINITVHKKDYNIILSVCDQGIGISEEDLKLLFEPFHRGQNVGPISGTGLGLSIAKKSAEMHHGSLAIQSKLNEGTKVIVTLKCE